MNGLNGIWITWEEHRRTRELAKVFEVDLHELLFDGPYGLRVLVLAFRTLVLLLKKRPEVLVVQNPSMVLASWVGFLKPLFGYYLIVDRHSNFKIHTLQSKSPKYRIFHWLSRYSLRKADLSILTNQPLVDMVNKMGAEGFVMPDRFPRLPLAEVQDLGEKSHVLFICTFADDEPLDEVIKAAELLGDEVLFHVTGNPAKAESGIVSSAPSNIVFEGYLAEKDYQSLLASVDVVLTLTTMPHTMQCGAYEAVAAFRPLVFGPDNAMVEYFSQGRVVTQLDGKSIAASISEAIKRGDQLKHEARQLHSERSEWWDKNLKSFYSRVGSR